MENNNKHSSAASSLRMNKKQMWLVGIGSTILLAIIVTLSVLFGLTVTDRGNLLSDSENAYQRSYYGLVVNLVDIENDLAKVRVMTGDKVIKDSFYKIESNCQIASTHLAVLSINSSSMESLAMFFNQLGGYSGHLINNLDSGKKLTTSNIETLTKLWDVSKEYGKALNGMQAHMADGYSFSESLGEIDDQFGMIFDGMNESAIEYPSLIYDGPFSDGVIDRDPKGTVGEELSEAQARELLPKYLQGYDIAEVADVVENNNRIPSFVYSVILKGERTVTVQIAKKGGMLLMLDLFHEVYEPVLTVEQCKVIASQYCESIGLKDMTAVWVNNNSSNVYVNMCYEQNGVILYPDMLKLKISLDTGEVIGYEGLNYAFNHTKRDNLTAKVSLDEAVLNASAILEDIEARLVVIPINVTSEKLCYELVGEFNGEKYFVYVDAMTGKEIKVLRMIDSNQGDLLM